MDAVTRRVENSTWTSKGKHLVGNAHSKVWKEVCFMKSSLRLGIRWEVENGKQINIWNELWILGQGSTLTENIPSNYHIKMVSEFIPTETKI